MKYHFTSLLIILQKKMAPMGNLCSTSPGQNQNSVKSNLNVSQHELKTYVFEKQFRLYFLALIRNHSTKDD